MSVNCCVAGVLVSTPQSGRPRIGEQVAPSLLREVHLAQECVVAWVRLDALEKPLDLDVIEESVALTVRALDPAESLISLATEGKDAGDLKGLIVLILAGEYCELSVRVNLAAK